MTRCCFTIIGRYIDTLSAQKLNSLLIDSQIQYLGPAPSPDGGAPDSSVDCIISNCVINLVPKNDKPTVFQEIACILKPGGRVAAKSDLNLYKECSNLNQNTSCCATSASGISSANSALGFNEWAGSYQIKWPSLLSVDGTPIEYSWKWNTKTKGPDVRFTMEPMSEFTGTALDPLNQRAFRELMHKLSQFVPGVELSSTDYFLSTLFDHNRSRLVQAVAEGVPVQFSSTAVAFEFLAKGLLPKTYYAPRKLGIKGPFTLSDWQSAIRGYVPESKALDAVHEFLQTSPEGEQLFPYNLTVDNIKGGRLKYYFKTPRRSFASVREILTLGGRVQRPGLEEQLLALRDLINVMTSMPSDFPEDGEPPVMEENGNPELDTTGRPELMAGYLYYFDIAPGAALPEIRFYIPIRRYCKNDLNLATALTAWMTAQGRGAHCDRYMELVRTLAEHRDLSKDRGLQRCCGCLLAKNGEVEVTTYLTPEIYEQVRSVKA